MKPSSCRTVSLLWRHLQASSLPAATATRPRIQCHHNDAIVGTATATRIPASTSIPKRNVSSALIDDHHDDYSDNENQHHHHVPRHVFTKYKTKHPIAAKFEVLNNRQQQQQEEEYNITPDEKQRKTECTCGYIEQQQVQQDNYHEPLPPPLPQPKYSVHKRVLPSNLTALSSPRGRVLLQESMADNMAESYWSLMEQFVNQSDPAYCGVTTLLMVCNAMNIDPNVRWKGGWRFYGTEDTLLSKCCLNAERIRRIGITMEQFLILGTCHGMQITLKRPVPMEKDVIMMDDDSVTTVLPQNYHGYSLDDFRTDIRQTLNGATSNNSILVTSFSRAALQQTGDGHFSPIAAYHSDTDQVLILDVARFKYAPYWTSVEELYQAMQPLDGATQKPRGWYIMKPPTSAQASYEMTTEDRRPAELVPQQKEACPIGKIKVQFCPASNNNNNNDNNNNKSGEDVRGPKELL